VCWDKDTTTAPADPASADGCRVVLGLTTESAELWIHRSDMDFGVGIWACQNAGCTEYYGDGTYGASVTNDTGTATTEELCYVVVGVEDDSETARVLSESDYPGITASAALMYPGGWTNANKLGIWWSYIDSGSGADTVKTMHATDTGWQEWNTYSGWSSVTKAAESGTGGPTDIVTHPWVIAVNDGSDK